MRLLALVARRALVQRRLLAAVVLLVAASASLLGVCSLLLGVTQDRAFHAELLRSQPQDVSVTAYLVDVGGADVGESRELAGRAVRDVLGPMRPSVTSAAATRMRRLAGAEGLAYLSSGDALVQGAELVSGRWPGETPAEHPEAAVPEVTARLLGLRLGDRVTLGDETGLQAADVPVTVVVVGTFRPEDRASWQGDPLAGQGFDATFSDGSVTAPAYGPFVVTDAALQATGSSVTGLRVTAHPSLGLAEHAELRAAVDRLDHADALLSARIADRARITRVASSLPDTLARIQAQQATTRATVLVLLTLGTGLAVAAALLAGWLLASVRDEERALLVSLGLSRRQQIGAASGEALVLAVVATLLAVPVAALVHSRLTHLRGLRDAGLAQQPTVTTGLVLAVLAGAVVLALALVLAGQDADTGPDRGSRGRAAVAARAGIAALLAGAAGLGWWQLRTQPPTTAAHGDLTLTLAPVLCLAAVTVLAVHLVPLLLTGAARLGDRSRGLVVPLAAQQAARRPHVGTAMVLIAAAVAAAVFGLSVRTTWLRSQEDQAALRVGSDLSLALAAAATAEDAEIVADALGQGPTSVLSTPVVNTPVALGNYLGDPGSPPVLVAVDARHAGALLRGRQGSGTRWSTVGARLAPGDTADGLTLAEGGTGITLRGRGPDGSSITVTPTAVVQDGSGLRSSVPAASLPLDGVAHPVHWLGPLGAGTRLVAVRLELDGSPGVDPDEATEAVLTGEVSVSLSIPGGGAGGAWDLRPQERDSPVRGGEVSISARAGVSRLAVTAGLDLAYFSYTGATVLASALPAPKAVPVAVSQDLVDAVGTKVGEELSATVGNTAVPLRVAEVVSDVPSAPGRVAVLADVDALSRVLIDAGRLDPVVDGWWVSRPSAAVEQALRSTHVGEVTTRDSVAGQLAQGPLRVVIPTALLTLVVAAAVMLLAGVGLVLSADRQRRFAEVAQLRALGLTRRHARRVLLVEHGAFVVPLVLGGGLIGLAAAGLLGPLLIRSDVGAAPVPAAVAAVPWAAEGMLVGGLLVASLCLTAVLAALQVGRSTPADLRGGGL